MVSGAKRSLKKSPILKARKTIMDSLNNPLHAKWYLERRMKREFSARLEYIEKSNDSEKCPEEVIKKIDGYINSLVEVNKLKQAPVLLN